MDAREYLRIFKRRWPLVVAVLVAALSAAWVTTEVIPPSPAIRSFKATTFMLRTTSSVDIGVENLETLAALTTIGEVPKRVAARLGFPGEPSDLATKIVADADPDTGLFRITASAANPEDARAWADTFAGELIGFIQTRRQETIVAQAASLAPKLDELKLEIQDLDARIPSSQKTEAELLRAQRDAKIRRYGLLYEAYQRLASSAAEDPGLQIIQPAVSRLVIQQGFRPPSGRAPRLLVAGLLGLIAGVGLVLLLERLDTRILTWVAAEKHFQAPVIAEIPHVSRFKRSQLAVGKGSNGSVTSDAFALLASVVLTRPSGNGDAAANSKAAPRSVLVTSPGSGEGKTTVVAQMAASLASMGKDVLVISGDFRRPKIHETLGAVNIRGLVDVLAAPDGAGALPSYISATSVPRVRILPSGGASDRLKALSPELLRSPGISWVIGKARESADVVLIDTPPLFTGDPASLLPHVDGVLVVARAGRTSEAAAERAGTLLRQLRAPVLGVALNGVSETPVPFGYYGRHARRRRRRRGFPLLGRLSRQP